MAFAGNFQSTFAMMSGAEKWGHGINPIHYVEGAGYGGRTEKEIHTMQGPDSNQTQMLDPNLLDPGEYREYGYTDEEFASATWGYGESTGTADRPPLGTATQQFRGVGPDDAWPGAPMEPGLVPGGTWLRAENKGAAAGVTAKLGDKEETVGEGWQNKLTGMVENAATSDPSQYEMQTSMVQRDKVRQGSQNPNTGTASEQMAPIESYRPTWGMRIKPWSGGRRHYDMTPREQNMIIRPFWYRTAGTGYVEYMPQNQAFNYQVAPLTRMPVPDPYAGVPVPSSGDVYQEESYPVQDYVNVWY